MNIIKMSWHWFLEVPEDVDLEVYNGIGELVAYEER